MINQLYNAFTLFLSLLVEAMPFLLLGVFLSTLLYLWSDEQWLIAHIPKNPIVGAFMGSCIGFLFPVCECGNVPVARRLLMQGVPPAVAIGFLLAAPTINPIVVISTYTAFRDQPEIVVLRVVFSLFIATFIGWLFSWQKNVQSLLHPLLSKRFEILVPPAENSSPSLLQSGTFLLGEGINPVKFDANLAPKIEKKWKQEKSFTLFLEAFFEELRELGGVLVLGSMIAACIQVFIPREIIVSLGQNTVTSILAMMVLAGVVSICSTVDSFFALSFASTFTSGSVLAFLVFGPMIDIKGLGLMLSIFRPKVLIYLFTLAGQLTFILTLTYSYFF